jgi:hypothetical protein
MTATATHRDRILEALRLSARSLDDDELADRAGISPRQTVNQICRELERDGILRRSSGPDGKLVNTLVSSDLPFFPSGPDESQPEPATAAHADSIVATAPDALPPGSSAEQRAAERVMLDLLGERLGVTLDPARLQVLSGARVEIDGADVARTVLVECWAHQGTPRAAQRHKVLADALKLTWIASTVYPRPRLVLCMSDPAAAAPFLPGARSWGAQALLDLRIAIEIVELPGPVRDGIVAAQARQYR